MLSGPMGGQGFSALFKTTLSLGSERNPVPRYEFEKPQDNRWIAFQLRGHAQKDPLVRNCKIGIRQARSPIPELGQQRAFVLSDQVDGATRLAIDCARIPEIFAHVRGGLVNRYKALMSNIGLGLEVQQVLIATRLVMQEAAQRAEKLAGLHQTSGHVRVRLVQLCEPSQQMQIA